MVSDQKAKRSESIWPIVKTAIAVVICVLAAFLLYRTLSGYSLEELAVSIEAFPTWRLFAAGGFAAASYFCLTFFDYLALRYVGKPLAYRKAALASFCSLSLGQNIGFSALSSGAVRYRFYSRWGLTGGEIVKVILFCALTVVIGLMTLGGISLLVRSGQAAAISGLAEGVIVAIALGCLALVASYVVSAAFGRVPVWMRRIGLTIPSLPIAIAQVIVGTLNYACVAACLYTTLLAVAELQYFQVVSVYVTSIATALISHVPGGLGVLESMVILLLPGTHLIGPLLIFRFVYFLVPLAIGGPLFAITELYFRPRRAELAHAQQKPHTA